VVLVWGLVYAGWRHHVSASVYRFLLLYLHIKSVQIVRWSVLTQCLTSSCERPCIKGELSYSFRMDFLSSTYGPALDPSWGEGEFDSIRGPYVFEAQKGLLLNRIRCISGAAWTIIIHAQLDKTKGAFLCVVVRCSVL